MFLLLIPTGTDAPIYHWPYATVAMMVINVAVFVAGVATVGVVSEHLPFPGYILQFGNGLHPLQWITANFLHADIFHLGGNMIFLWGFGILVEGKIGWQRFMLVYLGIGAIACFFEQLGMLSSSAVPGFEEWHGALGASTPISGLMAISLIWAPKNEISVWVFYMIVFVIRITQFECLVMTFAMWWLGLEAAKVAFMWWLVGPNMSSAVLHLSGAIAGAMVGVVMLKARWVDCENWDLFAVMSGTYGNRQDNYLGAEYRVVSGKPKKGRGIATPSFDDDSPGPRIKNASKKADAAEGTPRKKALARIRQLLDAQKPTAAFAEMIASQTRLGEFSLPKNLLEDLGVALFKMRQFQEYADLHEEYVARFPDDADAEFRLRLAGVLLEQQKRPTAALRLIEDIDDSELSRAMQDYRDKVTARARQLQASGILEVKRRP